MTMTADFGQKTPETLTAEQEEKYCAPPKRDVPGQKSAPVYDTHSSGVYRAPQC